MPENPTTDRIAQAFEASDGKLLSIFLTAGFPHLEDTLPLCQALQDAGVDMLELGFPFSDPLADGPTIQASNERALRNGMTLHKLFQQLEALRPQIQIPVLLMGYINPILQFGVEAFCRRCAEVGIDGLILPDLPLDEYQESWKPLFDAHGLKTVWLITPRTDDARVRLLDQHTTGFLYVVSSFAVTGDQLQVDQQKQAYFQRIRGLELNSPQVVGFGIHDQASFEQSTAHAHGAIIGSAFLKAIQRADSRQLAQAARRFVEGIRPPQQPKETRP